LLSSITNQLLAGISAAALCSPGMIQGLWRWRLCFSTEATLDGN
jgi:hypothetical protein